jgi:hypothetical protein
MINSSDVCSTTNREAPQQRQPIFRPSTNTSFNGCEKGVGGVTICTVLPQGRHHVTSPSQLNTYSCFFPCGKKVLIISYCIWEKTYDKQSDWDFIAKPLALIGQYLRGRVLITAANCQLLKEMETVATFDELEPVSFKI